MNPTPRKLVAQFLVTQSQVGLSTSRPVRAQVWNVGTHVFPHDHTFYEICVVNSGHATHQTEYFESPARQGTVAVIPPRKVHAFSDGTGLVGTTVYYLAEWLIGELKRLWEHEGLVPLFLADTLFPKSDMARPFQFDLNAREYASAMIELEDMQREWDAPEPSVLLMESCFLKFLILLSRCYVRQTPRETGLQFRRPVWMGLETIEETMFNSQGFSVSKLARRAGMSPDHFTRVFKEATGWSPSEYFQMRRVHHACNMLLNAETNISEVAYRLGYADAAHLSRVFKRFQGMSPREYRQTYAS